jgi:thiol-disulfide isomerase/thioredoxin
MSAEKSSEDGKTGFTIVAAIIALACLAGLVVLPKLARSKGKMAGKEAPAFALPVAVNSDPGARIDLKEMRGHAVLLDFWASWCGPCAMQAPILERVGDRYKDKGLTVVGVNVDDEPAVVAAYARQRGLSYPIVVDADGAVQRAYGVNKLPSLVLVDKDGKVAFFTQGLVDEASLESMVRDAL